MNFTVHVYFCIILYKGIFQFNAMRWSLTGNPRLQNNHSVANSLKNSKSITIYVSTLRLSTTCCSYGLLRKSTASSIRSWPTATRLPTCPLACLTSLALRTSTQTGVDTSSHIHQAECITTLQLHKPVQISSFLFKALSSCALILPMRGSNNSSWVISSSWSRRSTEMRRFYGITSTLVTIRTSWTFWLGNPVTCWLWSMRRATFQRLFYTVVW